MHAVALIRHTVSRLGMMNLGYEYITQVYFVVYSAGVFETL